MSAPASSTYEPRLISLCPKLFRLHCRGRAAVPGAVAPSDWNVAQIALSPGTIGHLYNIRKKRKQSQLAGQGGHELTFRSCEPCESDGTGSVRSPPSRCVAILTSDLGNDQSRTSSGEAGRAHWIYVLMYDVYPIPYTYLYDVQTCCLRACKREKPDVGL